MQETYFDPRDKGRTRAQLLTVLGALRQEVAELGRVQKKLKRSEEFIRTVFNSVTDCVYIIDAADFTILETNRAFRDHYGQDSETVIGRPCYRVTHNRSTPCGTADCSCPVAEVLQTGRPATVEHVHFDRMGDKLYFEVLAFPVRNDAGRIHRIVHVERNITERKHQEEERRQGIAQLRKALGSVIQALAVTAEIRDPYTAGHQRRVADLARAIATEMNLPHESIEGIRMAGTIHDIGKISVPAEILAKPTRLTDVEYSLIKTHPRYGYDILQDIEFPWPIARMILEHHERIDGSGYPNGCRGEELLIESRIISVADVVEAMASHRPYRPGLGIDAALGEIARNRGICYEPVVVDVCLRLFNEKRYAFPH